LPLGVVLGTFGVERYVIRFTGQAAHAGATPMDRRRDAFAPAAKLGLAIRDVARARGGLCTVGRVTLQPGIHTAVAGVCDMTLDARHADAAALSAMVADIKTLAGRFAEEELCEVAWTPIYRTIPIAFHSVLIDLCDSAVQEIAGAAHRLHSGPLHDAAEMARAGVPAVMMFVQSLRGISHNAIEDTKPEHLALAVEALDRLAEKTMAWIRSEAVWSPAGRS
jgi:N-carbamoyl-L-amino-acid hydrolase